MNARLELLDRRLDASLAAVATNDELAEVARAVASKIESLRTSAQLPNTASAAEREVARMLEQTVLERRQAEAAVDRQASPVSSDTGQEIDEALERMQRDCASTLERAGLSPEAVAMILTLVNVTADARSAKQQIARKRDDLEREAQVQASIDDPRPSVPDADVRSAFAAKRDALRERGSVDLPLSAAEDPLEPLSAAGLGARLTLHEQTVRTRERDGKLFSILRAGRRRGQEFPAFQAWPGVAGEPLERALAGLVPEGETAPVSGPQAYGFFTSPTYLLADLAPLEVLIGRALSERELSAAAQAALALPAPERVELVVKTARTIAATSVQ